MQAPEKIFYKDASDPKEALLLYKQHHNNNYDRIKEKIIKKVILETEIGKWETMQVLDVGSGGGIFTRFFLDLGAKVTALDNSPVVVEANRLDNPEVAFICGDAATIKLEKKFDFIFAKDIIEHIQDDALFLKNISDGLKNSGYILISTQNSFSFNYLAEKIYNLLIGNKNWMGWNPDHVRFYNYWLLKKELLKNNLVPLRWFGSYYFPYRGFAYFLGKPGEHLEWRVFRLIELLNLWGVWPFNILGWNIGVLAKKRHENKKTRKI